MIALDKWEHVQIGTEGTPGTYDENNFISLPIVRGSGSAVEVPGGQGSPVQPSTGDGRASTRPAVTTQMAYVERPLSVYCQFGTAADDLAPWMYLPIAAGFDFSVVEDTSFTLDFPDGITTNDPFSLLEEIEGGNDTKIRAARLADLEIAHDGAILTCSGTMRGLKVAAQAANAGLSTPTNYGGSWVVRYATGGTPFTIGGLALRPLSWRIRVASEVVVSMSPAVAFGGVGVGLSYGEPAVTMEATVLMESETAKAVQALVQSGTPFNDTITMTDGTRTHTFTLRNGVLAPTTRQPGQPTTQTLTASYHHGDSDSPMTIVQT